MKTSTAQQTSSPASKETSSASAPSSKTSKPTTRTDFSCGFLDHKATAEDLEYIATTGINIAKKSGSMAAIKIANANAERLLGLADWHLVKADQIKQQENLFRLSELKQSAENVLI